jgi:hypothetical protein
MVDARDSDTISGDAAIGLITGLPLDGLPRAVGSPALGELSGARPDLAPAH